MGFIGNGHCILGLLYYNSRVIFFICISMEDMYVELSSYHDIPSSLEFRYGDGLVLSMKLSYMYIRVLFNVAI